MPKIGVRELKNQTTEILRAVREQQAEYIVTYRGEPIAVLLPLDTSTWALNEAETARIQAQSAKLWEELAKLRGQIDQEWQSPQSGVQLLEQDRR